MRNFNCRPILQTKFRIMGGFSRGRNERPVRQQFSRAPLAMSGLNQTAGHARVLVQQQHQIQEQEHAGVCMRSIRRMDWPQCCCHGPQSCQCVLSRVHRARTVFAHILTMFARWGGLGTNFSPLSARGSDLTRCKTRPRPPRHNTNHVRGDEG